MKTSRAAFAVTFMVLVMGMFCAPAGAQTHASWPTDWNNWSDPALWADVGNIGNAGELCGQSGDQGFGPQATCGQVGYSYRAGKFEVTTGQYVAFLNAVAANEDTHGLYNPMMDTTTDPGGFGCNIKRQGTPGDYTYSVASDWADRPANWVSWGDAARYCNWLTNGQPGGDQTAGTTEDGTYALNGATTDAELLTVVRKSLAEGALYCIPTEDEWHKAAYHANDGVTGNYYDYPTLSDAIPDSLFDDPDPGNTANYDLMIDAPYYRTEAGECELSASAYGTYDQGGNVREWNEAVLLTDYRGLRGGSFADADDMLAGDWRACALPTTEDGHTGFRIAQIPEPTTLALLSLSGLAMLRRRRR